MTKKSQNYRIITIDNIYELPIIDTLMPILSSAGLELNINKQNIDIKFDVVDMKYIESFKGNPLIDKILDELYKIRSFSSANGKIVFKSFNKPKKVADKKTNSKKRLAYELFKQTYPTKNNAIPNHFVNTILCGDSLLLLQKFPDNCVDVVLTSPPYNFGITYENSLDVNIWNDYFDKLFAIFKECIRILKDSGRIIVNIQPMFSDYIPTHHIVSNFFLTNGLIWKGEILWEKNNYNCKYCTWGSWKSPAAPYLKYSWEFIEIFCKNSLKKAGDKNNIDIIEDEFKKWVYAKWSIAPERKMKEYKHDAMFPEELVRRCLKLFSYENNIILDPFNGVGTTTKVAKELHRKFVGIDISSEYCKIAESRIKEAVNLFNMD